MEQSVYATSCRRPEPIHPASSQNRLATVIDSPIELLHQCLSGDVEHGLFALDECAFRNLPRSSVPWSKCTEESQSSSSAPTGDQSIFEDSHQVLPGCHVEACGHHRHCSWCQLVGQCFHLQPNFIVFRWNECPLGDLTATGSMISPSSGTPGLIPNAST